MFLYLLLCVMSIRWTGIKRFAKWTAPRRMPLRKYYAMMREFHQLHASATHTESDSEGEEVEKEVEEELEEEDSGSEVSVEMDIEEEQESSSAASNSVTAAPKDTTSSSNDMTTASSEDDETESSSEDSDSEESDSSSSSDEDNLPSTSSKTKTTTAAAPVRGDAAVKLLMAQGIRGRDAGSEGIWDSVSPELAQEVTDMAVQQRRLLQKEKRSRQLSQWDQALDSGRTKKIKLKPTEEELAVKAEKDQVNMFQTVAEEYRERESQRDELVRSW